MFQWIDRFFKKIINFFKREEKIDPPETRAYIKINEVAKENGVHDDENKIIELHNEGKIRNIKYTEADVEALREQGIPVVEEEYTDEHDFLMGADFGGIEERK